MDNITYRVRQVRRGFWTYDLYFHDEGCRTEFSVGECDSRRDAERAARHSVKLEQLASGADMGRFGDFGRD